MVSYARILSQPKYEIMYAQLRIFEAPYLTFCRGEICGSKERRLTLKITAVPASQLPAA